MARYIDADLLVEELRELQGVESPSMSKATNQAIDLGLSLAIRTARKAPTADVAEVKHGEWIQEWELEKGFEDNDEIPYIKCSLCGRIEWNIDKEMNTTPNYCSKCGAKMDGGKEE